MQEKQSEQVSLQLEKENVEKDCTVPLKMDVDTLHEIELHCFQMGIDIATYAGNAFLDDDKEQMKFFKGFHRALKMLRKYLEEKQLSLLVEQDAKEEEESYASHYKEQLEMLLPHDHHLFNELVKGLVTEGWTEKGGSGVFCLLNKQGAAIKIFRGVEAPAVIKVCFSAEPEEAKVTCKSLKVEIKSREEDEET